MKLLVTFYVPSGGIETLNRLRSRALRKVGIDCHVLYTQKGAGLQNKSNIPTYIASSDTDLRSIIQGHQFDAILVSSDYLMLERLRRLGYAGTIIYEAQGLGAPELAEETAAAAAPFIQQYAQGIHLPTTSHLIQLFEKYCPHSPKFIFKNLVDYDKFHYRKSLKTPAQPIISWIGRLEQNKNWKDFIDICHLLVQHQPKLHIWMFIDPNLSQDKELESLINKVGTLNLRNKLTLHNNVAHAHMMDYLSMTGDSGGFLMSTSILEGFGYSIAEAMSCRCPVISSDSDGVRVFIQHNVTGKFYPHHDIQYACTEGLELLNNKKLRHDIRDRAVQHIKQNFQPAVYAHHFSNMLSASKVNK